MDMGSDLPAAPLVRPTFADLGKVAWAYLPDVLRLLGVRRADVEDLVNDTLIAAWDALVRRGGMLDPVAPGAPPERTIKVWLSGIAWRRASDYRRSARVRLEVLSDDDDDSVPDDVAPSSDQLAALKQRHAIVRRILSQMDQDRAEVLLMSDGLGMTATAVAEAVKINVNTVKSRLRRARAEFITAKQRLLLEEQRAIEHSPLVVPLGLWDGQPSPERGIGTTFAAVAAVAALAIGVGAGWSARGPAPAAPELPIVAVREAAPVEPETMPSAVTSGVSGLPAPEPAKPPSARLKPTSLPDTSSAELIHLDAARKALRAGAHDTALAHLGAHEREFPRGKLVESREWLRAEVRAAMLRDHANPPAE